MMKTVRRYSITALVAALAFMPFLYRLIPNMSWVIQFMVAVLIAVVAGFIEHYRSVRPRLKMENKRTRLFGMVCVNALEELHEHDPTARLNIMEIDQRFVDSWSVFEIVYGRGMAGDPDQGLRLKLNQGVCGQAVAQRAFCVANLEIPHGPTFNLDPDQLEKTKNLTLIMSMPIKRAEKMQDGTFILTDDIIGVVNIDSKREGAYDFYENTIVYGTDMETGGRSLLEMQTQVLRRISELCSYIMS